MKLSWTQIGIDVGSKNSGSVKVKCPKCIADRKHKSDTSLSVDLDRGIYHCHHCQWKGSIFIAENKNYARPKQNLTNLSEKTKKWFLDRGIEENVLQYFKITESEEWMPEGMLDGKIIPAGKRNTINFNYFRDSELINVKFRDAKKSFRLVKDAEMIFYNLDAIKGKKECCIVEGELDCMAMYQAGYFYAISVPNGAPKSTNINMAYLDNCWESFEEMERIYIATDQDEAGSFLRGELIRRLGAERCYVVKFEDCKDANDYLKKYGGSRLLEQIRIAEPVPMKGIWKAESFKDKIYNLWRYGREKPFRVGLGGFDDLLSFRSGDLTVVTGIPSHGKSYFCLWLMVLLSAKYGWKWVMFAPENMPEEELVGIIASMFMGEQFDSKVDYMKMSEESLNLAYEFINNHFYFFKFDEADISVDGIVQTFKSCVKKYGVKGGMIDPWNKVEHLIPKGFSETQYINETLSKLTSLCKLAGVHIFFIAHPTKMQKNKDTGEYEVPNLYSISGSAHWYNQCDNGVVVYRNKDNSVSIVVQKVRWKFVGSAGEARMNFQWQTGRYHNEKLEPILPYRYWLEYMGQGISFEEQQTPLSVETKNEFIDYTEPQKDDDLEPYPF